MGQPQTVLFSADQTLPYIIPTTIVQLNAPIAIVVALVAWLLFSRFVFGFQVRVVGAAPHAARYGGFSANQTIWLALLISGGLAGFAGVLEAMGPFGRLVPQFPTNYGFTAIIVAFLGRLHPLGVVLAGIIVAISFVGG
jgi:simple sugar transport system permease protein